MKAAGKSRRRTALRSLRSQLLARTLLILALLLVLIGFLQYFLMKDFLYRSRADAMGTQLGSIPADLLIKDSQEKSGSSTPKEGINRKDNRPRPFLFWADMSLASIDTAGTFTSLSNENGLTPPRLTAQQYISMQQNKHMRYGYQLLTDAQGNEQLVVFRPLGPPDHSKGLLQMGVSTTSMQEQLINQLRTFILLSLIALAIGLALMLPVLRRTLVPLSRMVEAVKRIDAGNLAERFDAEQGQYEVDRLAVSFNGMLERLEHSFAAERELQMQMRRFIADASHELRTPLTSIHGFLEVLLRGAASNPKQLQSALESMYGESKRMNKLVSDLLLLAKLDRTPELKLEDMSLDTLLLEMKPQLLMLAGKRRVIFDMTAGVRVLAEGDKIKQVVLNLFHNAVQHTDMERGVIHVNLSAGKKLADIQIRDNGPGMSKEQLDRIFERFYRGDESRTRSSGGAGLGLAITQSIVEAHGGKITAASTPGEGSVFKVALPLAGTV
ncbi:HAMP domain-containing sensor histidine kinase [Paenibacillus sp. FSL R10-2782]|uniref:histidine kinase n=1 Tax=Paenibacillus terrae TaxID=159743 RepID=A0A4V5SQC4_9BACL|nr:HAMP domain-containing sensor histidine kinase [Paenibacillus terrae]TKH45221.1 two-component sensor histidine kinase [Paenibacillus terrae]